MKLRRYFVLLILGPVLVFGPGLSAVQDARSMPIRAEHGRKLALPSQEVSRTLELVDKLVTVPRLFSEAARLTASDATDIDYFGVSSAVNGETAVVGAFHKNGAGSKRGAAYVFQRNQGGTDNWGQVRTLLPADAEDEDWFGVSVAISGDTVVVGADGEDGAGIDRGAAYVFERTQGGAEGWGQVKKLTASDAMDLSSFGSSVAISENTIVVGAPRDNGAGRARGAAYVFARDQDGSGNWGQVKKLIAADAADYAEFGRVSVSGDTIVVGSPFDSDRRGAAYVYERNQGGPESWGQVKKLTASDAAEWDFLGGFVANSGDTVVVGAHGEAGAGNSRGAAYVYERNRDGMNNWGEVTKLTAPDSADNDWFGDSVAISGDTVVVGADWKDGGGRFRGAVYVYARNHGGTDSWGQVQKLISPNSADLDFFGVSSAISGETIVIGAQGEVNRRGAAYVFGPRQKVDIYLPLAVR